MPCVETIGSKGLQPHSARDLAIAFGLNSTTWHAHCTGRDLPSLSPYYPTLPKTMPNSLPLVAPGPTKPPATQATRRFCHANEPTLLAWLGHRYARAAATTLTTSTVEARAVRGPCLPSAASRGLPAGTSGGLVPYGLPVCRGKSPWRHSAAFLCLGCSTLEARLSRDLMFSVLTWRSLDWLCAVLHGGTFGALLLHRWQHLCAKLPLQRKLPKATTTSSSTMPWLVDSPNTGVTRQAQHGGSSILSRSH